MKTHCNQKTFEFQTENSRKIVAHFNGGNISSDSGGLLLRQVEQITDIIRQFAGCFTDYREPDLTEHTIEELIAQRIYVLALGYEDLNDHDELRNDPLLAVMVGKKDPTGLLMSGRHRKTTKQPCTRLGDSSLRSASVLRSRATTKDESPKQSAGHLTVEATRLD